MTNKEKEIVMPKYSVPVCITISSDVEVIAASPEQALELAMEMYDGPDSLIAPCIDTDFACVEDVVEVKEENP